MKCISKYRNLMLKDVQQGNKDQDVDGPGWAQLNNIQLSSNFNL